MLGLRKQIGGDPGGIVRAVGDHQDLRGSCDHVDADDAEDPPLGRRHEGIAGPDDLGDRGDAVGPLASGRDGQQAAVAVDGVRFRKKRRRHDQRVQHAVGRRHGHHQTLDARDLRR